MTPSDTSKFDKEEIAAVLDANQIPRATFVEADGRCVSLPYHSLTECIFASKDKKIIAKPASVYILKEVLKGIL